MASSKIKGITIEIGGNTTKLGKALEGVNKQSKDLQSELKGVNLLLKLDPSNVELLKQKQDLLTKSITETESKQKILSETLKQIDSTKVYTIEGNTSSAAGVVSNGGCVREKIICFKL